MYMYVRLQVHLAPIPYDSTSVSVSVFVVIAATTAANIFLCQIMQSSHIDPRAPQAEKRHSERPA